MPCAEVLPTITAPNLLSTSPSQVCAGATAYVEWPKMHREGGY